jgi:hypothetical protein
VVVALGLTACVPPVAARVYELPSLPATVTEVAFAAVTVRVEDAPAAIDAGLAVMATVGAVFVGVLTFAEHPVNSSGKRRAGIVQKIDRQTEWRTRALIKVFSFQSLEGSTSTRRAPWIVGPCMMHKSSHRIFTADRAGCRTRRPAFMQGRSGFCA